MVEMKPGDLVIVPPNKPRPSFLARIIGPAREYRGKDPDIAFERRVEWLNGKQPFMRAEASAQLNVFLNSRGTSRLLQDVQLLREVESLIGGNKWLYPDELDESARYWEGTQRQVIVNAYERDPKARAACIKHYGAVCVVCGFDFEAQYGEYGARLIHVHHLRPLSKVRKGYRVDPKLDLRPVCPNCHAIIHWKRKMLSITEARRLAKHRFEW